MLIKESLVESDIKKINKGNKSRDRIHSGI